MEAAVTSDAAETEDAFCEFSTEAAGVSLDVAFCWITFGSETGANGVTEDSAGRAATDEEGVDSASTLFALDFLDSNDSTCEDLYSEDANLLSEDRESTLESFG